MDPADVIGMPMRADDPGDVFERTAHSREIGAQEPRGPRVARVDERDLVSVDEQISLSADEPHNMNVW
jgi:hypothetical protein